MGGVGGGGELRGGQAGEEAAWVATGGAILAWAEADGLLFTPDGSGAWEPLAGALVASGNDAAG